MTQAAWLNATDLAPILVFMQGSKLGSERKSRLFAVACCRHIWPFLTDPGVRAAVEVFEGFAEGVSSRAEVRQARVSVERAFDAYNARVLTGRREWSLGYWQEREARNAVRAAGRSSATLAALYAVGAAARAVRLAPDRSMDPRALAILLSDIFGPLPCRDVRIDATWLTDTAVALAQAAYEHRQLPSGHLDRQRLAVLADALEEAGCTDAELLGHLRGPGPCVRGCFVLDLVLNKE